MKFGLLKTIRNMLAPLLALILMITSALPAAANVSEISASSPTSSVTETVYGKVGRTAATAIPGPPLSWNVLSKLNHGFTSLMYAASDRPISELSSDEKYLAFLTYDMSDEVGIGRKVVQIQDRATGELHQVKTPSATGWVHHFDMSSDARYVAFSYSEELISPNVKVYLYDRSTDILETVNGVGSTAGFPDFDSNKVSISDDGRFVAFDTEANIVDLGDEDGKRDVYRYDRQGSGIKLQRLSVPLEANFNDESRDPSISADGSKIAFVSKSKLTALDDYIGTESLYLYDSAATGGQALKRVTQGYTPSISGDGRWMTFTTYRDDLGSVDTNGTQDIYVYDATNGNFQRVSLKPDGTEFDLDSINPSISRNGTYVAFETEVLVIHDGDEDVETEAYVADSHGLTSAKVAVPGAPLSLIPSAKRPVVSDTGTVNFYSFYVENFGGTEFPFPDYFIAANGSAPVWPSGSTLQASNLGADHITLSWPGVSDPNGVTGYAIYKNGNPITYIAATGQASYSVALTNQVRDEGMDYLFQVEAIDSKYHWSLNGPTYNWESDGDGNPPPQDLFLFWNGERSDANGPLKQESTIKITARGASGLATKLQWTYKEETSGVVTSKSNSMLLTESQTGSGFYTGTFKMSPNATELSSIVLMQKKADGTEVSEHAENLPIAVGGGLQVQFSNATLQELRGAILTVWGESGEHTLKVEENGVKVLTGLMPGTEYVVYLHTPDHRYEMGRLDSITVRAGQTNTVILPVTLPAQARVKVVNNQGKPVANVPVTLWDADHELLMSTTTAVDGMSYSYDDLLRDQIVTAELDLSDLFYEYAPGTNLSMKLVSGDNVLTVNLISPDRGMLELTVKDPANKPVFNAYVTATQMYRGKPIVMKARTSLDGKVRMEGLFVGDVVLEASESSYLYSSGQVPAQVTANSTTVKDIPVRQPGQGIVNLKVFKKALDTEWQGPLNMENEMFLSHVESKFGWISTYFSNAVSIGGSRGTPVNVCVSGAIYAYVSQCKDFILDENSNATAEMRLEETGARVQGKVELRSNIYYGASVYEIKPNGSKVWVANAWDNNFQTEPFNINVPRAGNYRMEINRSVKDANSRYRYDYASVDFSVAENQIKNLGEITFSPSQYFTNKTGNYFMAQTVRATPGSTVSLRASYRNNNDNPATNADLLLDIPDGTTLVSDELGNKAVTGAKGPVTVEGNTLRVPVGTLAKNDEGTVVYKLAVSPSFNKDTMVSVARIDATLGSVHVVETLGKVYLDMPKVTLDAPERITDADRGTVLSGFAPAGSTLVLYDSNVRIGGVVANASGVWKTSVTLVDLGDPGFHALWAETTVNAVNLKSEKTFVMYDTHGPQLLRMAMAQAPAGRWVTMETGAPDFAYTVVPGNPFLLDFEFSNPDQVENVRVYMDGQEGEPIAAIRDGILYRATVPTKHDALGGIYIDYDVKKPERTYDGTMPDLDQVRASLPPGMKDFEVVSKTPFELVSGVYTGTVVIKFPQLSNKQMSITLTIDPDSNYEPTEEEKVLAARSGVPAIQSSFEVNETDTFLSIKTHGYMPSNLLSEEFTGLTGLRALGRPAKAGDWGHTAEYFMEIKSDVDEVKGPIDEFKGQYEDYMGFAGKVNKIMYNVETSGLDCLEELPATVKQGGKALASLVVGEVAKTALGAWTGAMALTGGGAVVAGFASGVLEDKIDNYVDEQIDAIGSGYNRCSDNPDRKKNKGYNVARPKWIYDPSGYVYEAVKSNPLSDVTATVMYQDKNSGVWKVWNAKEYDQINPQLTDGAGKYGWDVPPGKWKVEWRKAGYQPVSSEELDVPPPQTEVNAGMISWDAPQISTVTGVTYSGGSYVDITFSKYLKVVDLKEEAVVIQTEQGVGVEGTAAFIQKEESASDKNVMLSKTIRFTPKVLKAGIGYKLKLNPAYITSYAGRKIEHGDAGFTAKVLDTTGPTVSDVAVESGGRIVRIIYNEPISTTADVNKIQLNGVTGLITSAVADLKRGQTETRDLLLTVDGAVTAASVLTLMEGAVKDLQGNASAFKVASMGSAPPPPTSEGGGGASAPPPKDPLDLGEKAVIEKKSTSSGGNAFYLTIEKEAIAGALKEIKPSQELYIKVKEPADEIILQFPAESVGQIADAKATIRLISDGMSFKLDPAVFTIGKTEVGAKVRVTINLAKGQMGKDAEEAASKLNMNWQLLTAMASVRVDMVNGTQIQPVSLAKKNAIVGNYSGLQGTTLEIYRYDPITRIWSYVRSVPNGNGQGLQFDMSSTNIFAVMSYTNRFRDTVNHWAMQDIDWMARRLLINGVSQAEFRPEGSVTRAEFAAMLVRALGIQSNGSQASTSFSDVNQNAWYYNEVLAAVTHGLVDGFESGQFGPDEKITREQMAVMISRAYKLANSAGNASSAVNSGEKFKDSDQIQSWAKQAVALVLKDGIMQGMTDETFVPDGITTRAQAAVVLKRFLIKQE